MSQEFLMIEAMVPATAGAPARPHVMGLAYAGGKINLPNWKHPVVVDLAGLEIPASVPLLANHENRTASRVGMVAARSAGGALEIEGDVVAESSLAHDIVAQAKAGADWQLSIGAEVKASELVRAGVAVEVNGRKQDGPFHHIRQSVLREVSVVAVGADGATRLTVVAQFHLTGGNAMAGEDGDGKTNSVTAGAAEDAPFQQWLKDSGIEAAGTTEPALAKLRQAFASEKAPPPAPVAQAPAPVQAKAPAPAAPELASVPGATIQAGLLPAGIAPKSDAVAAQPRESAPTVAEIQAASVKAERERVKAVREMCGFRAKLADEAITAGWDVDFTARRLLAEVNSEKPQKNELAGGYRPLPADLDQKFLEAQLCRKVNLPEDDIAAHYGDAIAERVRRGNGCGLLNLFRLAAKVGGHNGEGDFDDDMLYAALNSTRVNAGFTGFSLPGILSNVANKTMMRSFEMHSPLAPRLCRESSVSDFKERECFRLTEIGELEEIGADGEIKHGAMVEERQTISAQTRGKMYGIPRKWIVNDDMGAFDGLFSGLGATAARNLDPIFFRRLMSNPNGLFSAEHGNYLEGPDSALTLDGLQKGRELFQLQTDVAGNPIMIMPKYLLVPVAQEMQASEILHSTTVIAVGAENKRRIPTDNPLARVGLEHIVTPYLENARYPGNSRKAWYLFADPYQCDSFEIVYLYGKKRPTVQTAEADFNQLGMQIRVFWDFGVKEKDHRGIVKSKGEA